MLEKLATHEVESVTMLFSLADKCARAAEGCAWHSAPKTESPRLVAPKLPSKAVARKIRTRTTVAGGPRLEPQSLRQQHQL